MTALISCGYQIKIILRQSIRGNKQVQGLLCKDNGRGSMPEGEEVAAETGSVSFSPTLDPISSYNMLTPTVQTLKINK